MNRREKILAIGLGAILVLVLGYGAVSRLVLAPARALDARAVALRTEIGALRQANRDLTTHRTELARLRERTFADEYLKVTVRMNGRIDQIARAAGLSPEKVRTSTFTGVGRKDNYREIGCLVTCDGTLETLVNFLYLLSRDPFLHRISNLTLTPMQSRGQVKLSLRYATLVLDGKGLPKRRQAATAPVELAALTSSGRADYDVIAKRDFFRRYSPPRIASRPPRRPPTRPPTRPPARPPTPPRPVGLDALVVTGLPARGPEAEVHLGMRGQDPQKILKVGDKLSIGQVVMVDYRELPKPGGKPDETSLSRVIFMIGKDYWAVEIGDALGTRRVLRRKNYRID